MAKSRSTVFDYYFREGSGPSLMQKWKLNYEVAKIATDGSGIPENTYHIWGDSVEGLVCDCPAAYHHAAQGPCKHVVWTRRWLRIMEEDRHSSNYSFRPVYYSASKDAFFRLPTANLEDTLEDR